MKVCRLSLFLLGVFCLCVATSAGAQAVSGTPSTASAADVSFIKQAALDGVGQVTLGQLALKRSSDERVTKLAHLIIDDYSKAMDELRTLAHGKQVMLPTPPSDASEKPASVKGKDALTFDQTWVDAVVKDHQKAVAMFTTEKRQAQDPDARNFADRILPMLDNHLDRARALQDALALPAARDDAMSSHSAIGDSAFDHASSPATSATAPTMITSPAPATSMGKH